MPEKPDLNGIEKRWRDQRFNDFRLWEWLMDRARSSVKRGNVAQLSRFVERMELLYSKMVNRDTARFMANGVRHQQQCDEAAMRAEQSQASHAPEEEEDG